ncbi:MAG: hypothetical protein ACRCST_01760 [Turicibacter sp.]
MELYAKIFILLAVVRLGTSLLNINKKRLSAYDLKKLKVLDDRYFKIAFICDVFLCVGIIIISLVSPMIHSIGLYAAICAIMIIIATEVAKLIGNKKMYIQKIR